MASGGGGDPYFANVSLLLHMDGANLSTTFTDSSPNAFTMTTAGGAQISTAQSKFGGASGLFASSGDQITHATDADFDFGTGDFSIEWFQRWTSISGNQTVYDYGYTAANGLLVQTGAGTGTYRVFIDTSLVLTEGSAASTGTWHYYCLTRSGTTVTLRRDGTITGSGTSSGNISGGTLAIGDGYTPNARFQIRGYLDEMRVTKGVVRDGSVVPTAPFPDS